MFSSIPLPNMQEITIPKQLNALNELQKQRLQNKFLPLDKAIQSQNSLNYNNRTGNIAMFLRSIAEMPSTERQAYLSVPENRSNFLNMVENFRSGINKPNNNILTPEYVQSFGIGSKNNNPINEEFENKNYQPNKLNEKVSEPTYNKLTDNVEQSNYNEFNNKDSQPVKSSEPQKISPEDRDLYRSQLTTNNKSIGKTLQNRADAAIAFESYLQRAQPDLSKAFSDAFKYNSLYGRAKNWEEKFKQDQPEEYANYIFAKKSATKLIGNGVRFLEAMGVSHEAQQDANELVAQIDKLSVSPDTAIKVFNKTIKSLYDLSEGVLTSAEPAFPGVRRKLSDVKKYDKDYIQQNLQSDKNKKTFSIPEGRILVRRSDGQLGTISASQWERADKKKYQRM